MHFEIDQWDRNFVNGENALWPFHSFLYIYIYLKKFVLNKFSLLVPNNKCNIYANKLYILNCCLDIFLYLFLICLQNKTVAMVNV